MQAAVWLRGAVDFRMEPVTMPRSTQRLLRCSRRPAPESPMQGAVRPLSPIAFESFPFKPRKESEPAQKVLFEEMLSNSRFALKHSSLEIIGELIMRGIVFWAKKSFVVRLFCLQPATTPCSPTIYCNSGGPDHKQAGRINVLKLEEINNLQ